MSTDLCVMGPERFRCATLLWPMYCHYEDIAVFAVSIFKMLSYRVEYHNPKY